MTIDDKGFGLALPDRSYVLKIRGLLQTDGRFFFDDQNLQANNTFLIRRFRPSLDGTLFGLVDFRMVPEFAGNVTILDAYIDVHPWEWLRVRAGKMKGPVGLERLQSDADLALLERALDQNLSSQRDVGVVLWGDVAGGVFQYIAGGYNGDPDNSRRRRGHQPREGLRRAAVLPSVPNRGAARLRQPRRRVSVAHRQPQGPHSPQRGARRRPASRRTGPPVRTRSSSTWHRRPTRPARLTMLTHERATRLNPQLYYYYGPFGLLAEYLWLRAGRPEGEHHHAAHAAGGARDRQLHASADRGLRRRHAGARVRSRHAAPGRAAARVPYGWLGIDDATFPTYANPLTSARTAQAFTGGADLGSAAQRPLRRQLRADGFKGGAARAAPSMTGRWRTGRPST